MAKKKRILNHSMRIVTINVPEVYLAYIKAQCDKENAMDHLGFEPSRSEYIRHAIKDKIIRDNELGMFFKKSMMKNKDWDVRDVSSKLEEELTLVRVPYVHSRRKPLGNGFYNKGMNEE